MIQHEAQIEQKSINNPTTTILQKMIKNPSTIDQHRGLEGVWTDSGSQARLGKHVGWLRNDFRGQDDSNLVSKMEPNGAQIDKTMTENRSKN